MRQRPLHRLGLDQGPRDVAELRFTSKLRLSLLRLEADHLPHRIEVGVRDVARSRTHTGRRVLRGRRVPTRSLFGAGRLGGRRFLLSDLRTAFASLHSLICFLRDDSLSVSVNWFKVLLLLLLLLLVHFRSELPLIAVNA